MAKQNLNGFRTCQPKPLRNIYKTNVYIINILADRGRAHSRPSNLYGLLLYSAYRSHRMSRDSAMTSRQDISIDPTQ